MKKKKKELLRGPNQNIYSQTLKKNKKMENGQFKPSPLQLSIFSQEIEVLKYF